MHDVLLGVVVVMAPESPFQEHLRDKPERVPCLVAGDVDDDFHGGIWKTDVGVLVFAISCISETSCFILPLSLSVGSGWLTNM